MFGKKQGEAATKADKKPEKELVAAELDVKDKEDEQEAAKSTQPSDNVGTGKEAVPEQLQGLSEALAEDSESSDTSPDPQEEKKSRTRPAKKTEKARKSLEDDLLVMEEPEEEEEPAL